MSEGMHLFMSWQICQNGEQANILGIQWIFIVFELIL